MRTYPEPIIERLHESLLTILDAIAKVCEEHDISWYLVGGTCLGAARHQGFIPWDDDVDIGMLREEYDRFLEIAPSALPEDFELLTPETTRGYAPLFAKVVLKKTRFQSGEALDAGLDLGIFVDIFPRDPVAANPLVRKRQAIGGSVCTALSYLYYSDKINHQMSGIAGKLARAAYPVAHRVLQRVTSPKTILKTFKRCTRLSPKAKSIGSTSYTCPTAVLPNAMFEHPIPASFEGRMFPAPNTLEEYCEAVYGASWSQLPPVEQRANHAPEILDFGDGINVMEVIR